MLIYCRTNGARFDEVIVKFLEFPLLSIWATASEHQLYAVDFLD